MKQKSSGLAQIELIPEIKRLCIAGQYDSAIRLTNEIENQVIAIKAHLLCMEYEERARLDGKLDY